MTETETAPCKPRVRPLYDWEIEEARIVFADQLRYESVRVHECAAWPDVLDKFGRRLKGMSLPEEHTHNAITIGNNCFFPVRLPETPAPPGQPTPSMGWLIHELTHAWQFQQMGWAYLFRALMAQLREGKNVYHFGGKEKLKERRKDGWTLRRFNLEQQGAITQEYYDRRRAGEDVSEWIPFINDIHTS